ncbi:MAG: hypothetical protein M0021_09810 [Clostridia bacterium]|nr:hypothetical protein [Clostridia bacterium]
MINCPHCTYEITPIAKPKKNAIYFLTLPTWALSGLALNQWLPHTGQGITSAIIAGVVYQMLKKVLVKRYCPLCEKEIATAKSTGTSKEEQLNKRLSEFENFWFENHHCELPDVAKQIILEGGSKIAAIKAAKRAIGEPDTWLGSFKAGLQEGSTKEKSN